MIFINLQIVYLSHHGLSIEVPGSLICYIILSFTHFLSFSDNPWERYRSTEHIDMVTQFKIEQWSMLYALS